MNTVSTALHRIAVAMDALTPYKADATLPVPAGLLSELADAILSAPAEAIDEFDSAHPGEGEGLLSWAQDYIERRDYPDFFALMAEIGRIRDEQGDKAVTGPEHSDLFVKLLCTAPPRYRSAGDAILADALPTATHVSEDGEPVYSAQQIAEKFGVSEEEVETHIQALKDAGLWDGEYSGIVHAIQ